MGRVMTRSSRPPFLVLHAPSLPAIAFFEFDSDPIIHILTPLSVSIHPPRKVVPTNLTFITAHPSGNPSITFKVAESTKSDERWQKVHESALTKVKRLLS